MAGRTIEEARFFDYLDEYRGALQKRLGPNADIDKIAYWRTFGKYDYDAIVTGSRKFLECALLELSKELPAESTEHNHKPSVYEMLISCRSHRVIGWDAYEVMNDIRRGGNKGAHVGNELVGNSEATHALERLDRMFRYLLRKWRIDTGIPKESGQTSYEVFQPLMEQDIARLREKEGLAESLTDSLKVKEIVDSAVKDALEADLERRAALDDTDFYMRRIDHIREALDTGDLDDRSADLRQRELDSLQALVSVLDERINWKADESRAAIDEAEKKIDEILSEFDFIRTLLSSNGVEGKATNRQMRAMAFPKTPGATTNTLLLRGGAGTGKTLCLLAKLIQDQKMRAEAMGDTSRARALFVCFNKDLAAYVRQILNRCCEEHENIDVVSYDAFVNHLVKHEAPSGFKRYCSDVRYESTGWRVIYSEDAAPLLREATAAVIAGDPEIDKWRYFDLSRPENLEWLFDEIHWLDSRYDNADQASERYLTESRVGRGGQRRPSEEARAIILDIWRVYEGLLKRDKRYTVEGTTKRLMRSKSLPQYDFIAVDEVQDFSVASLKLITRMRASEDALVCFAGDEGQKLYQRDFTWAGLGDSVRGYTITLDENLRNAKAIRSFADRLLGGGAARDAGDDSVRVVNATDDELLAEVKKLVKEEAGSSIAFITDARRKGKWKDALAASGVDVKLTKNGEIFEPGLYLITDRKGKGLEFDIAVVDYLGAAETDGVAERNLRYMQFTRARNRLLVRYGGVVPKLLCDHYGDYLEGATGFEESGEEISR